MIDSHCHLDHEPLNNNLTSIIKRAKDAGVEKMLTICTSLNSYQDIDLQIYFEHEYFTIGADQNGPDQIENSDRNKKIVLVLGSESSGIEMSIKNKINKLI